MSYETVPGMAEAIDARRAERGLSPSEFAANAGVTPQGLAPVRRGDRKLYQSKVRIGVARALWWPEDWFERLEAGDDPSTFPTVVPDDALASDEIRTRLAELESEVAEIRTALAELVGPDVEGSEASADTPQSHSEAE